jgi:hypothetical protein
MIKRRAFDRFRLARGQGMSRCIESTPFDELHGTVSGDLLKSRVQCPSADPGDLAESLKPRRLPGLAAKVWARGLAPTIFRTRSNP